VVVRSTKGMRHVDSDKIPVVPPLVTWILALRGGEVVTL
jgi:hypothetical protein